MPRAPSAIAPINPEKVAELQQAAYISKLMCKDLEAAMELADELGIDLSVVPIALADAEITLGLKEGY